MKNDHFARRDGVTGYSQACNKLLQVTSDDTGWHGDRNGSHVEVPLLSSPVQLTALDEGGSN